MGASRIPATLTRHVDVLWPEITTAATVAEQVRAMLSSPGWAAVSSLLEAKLSAVDNHLDSFAGDLSLQELAFSHGQRGGLKALIAAPRSIVEHIEGRLADERSKHETGAESSDGGD